jgi:GR25 family glycosyltransferase involved in LPS biosynthesis
MHIYCINLKTREDKKQYCIEEFKKLKIKNVKIIFPEIYQDVRGGVYGCYESHIKVWGNFYEKYPKEKYCIVFEDDFIINEEYDYIVEKIFQFIEKNYKHIDILFLHNLNIIVEDSLNNEYFSKGYGLFNHAYIINRNYIKKVFKKGGPKAKGYHIDYNINFNKNSRLYSKKLFYLNIPWIEQKNYDSDNYLNKIDEISRIDNCKLFKKMTEIAALAKKTNIINDNIIKDMVKITNNINNFFNLLK